MQAEFPTTCPTCKQRRDFHDSSFRDWESARKPLERAHAAEVARLRAVIHEAHDHCRDESCPCPDCTAHRATTK